MKAAIYARFSSDNQREQSIEDQVRVCREYAQKNEVSVLEDHIYVDEAKSGSIRNRPGLEALKKAAESKLFDTLLIDDSSRLSRDNQYFNTLLCLFQFWGLTLISVSDGLNTQEEHAKVAYQFRGIFNELYLSDLRKKTHRGQMGQVLKGYNMGYVGYGYRSKPVGELKPDKKGRLRAEGFTIEIQPEEAVVVKNLFESFTQGKSINGIVKELNDQKIPTFKRLRGGWNLSTISRILKSDRYIGKYTWNKTTSVKDPLSGKIKKVARPKSEWIIQDRPEMKIISDVLWQKTQLRWQEIENTNPIRKGKRGFSSKQKSFVSSHPPHLLSGNLKCGLCQGSMALVSGKGSGYYGCINAIKKTCTNKLLISRKRLEAHFISVVHEKAINPKTLRAVFEKTAEKIKDHYAHIPEEIKLKKLELNRHETRIHNFVEFIAEGKATASLSAALEEAETKVKALKSDVEGMEHIKESAFEPPPIEWITHRLNNIRSVLEKRTSQSALLLRKLLGPITMTPKQPDQERAVYHARCKLKTFGLWENSDKGSNSLHWWRWRESNPRPKWLTGRRITCFATVNFASDRAVAHFIRR